MTQKTEEEAYLALGALCARAEHCRHELREKMRRWQLDEEAQQRVIERLEAQRYVDDERYALALVSDKVNFNKWGPRKVEQALWQKHIDEPTRRRALDSIGDDHYVGILRQLLRQKRNSTRAASDYELNLKLYRFALGRGFTPEQISQCIDTDATE